MWIDLPISKVCSVMWRNRLWKMIGARLFNGKSKRPVITRLQQIRTPWCAGRPASVHRLERYGTDSRLPAQFQQQGGDICFSDIRAGADNVAD